MTLSIIIPTKDRPGDIQKCIESILKQSFLPQQIIIVDSSKNNDTENILRDQLDVFKGKYIYVKSEPGTNYQRNVGIQFIDSDLALFLDDDVILDKDYIEVSKCIFADDLKKEIIGITGKIKNQKPLHFLSSVFRKLFFLPEMKDGRIKYSGLNNSINPEIDVKMEVDWLSGSNMCWRKEVLNIILFDENLTRYSYFDDVDFSVRAAQWGKLIYVPTAKLIHNVSTVSRLSIRERRRILICNHSYLFKKNRRHDLRPLISFYLSLVGYILQSIFFERSFEALIGTGRGIFDVIFLHNHRFPEFQQIKQSPDSMRYLFQLISC